MNKETSKKDDISFRQEIEAEFYRIRCIVACAGAACEALEPTAFAREAATTLLSDAAKDLAVLHERVHAALGGA